MHRVNAVGGGGRQGQSWVNTPCPNQCISGIIPPWINVVVDSDREGWFENWSLGLSRGERDSERIKKNRFAINSVDQCSPHSLPSTFFPVSFSPFNSLKLFISTSIPTFFHGALEELRDEGGRW